MPKLLVDTGPLVALMRDADRYHRTVSAFLKSFQGSLLTTWLVMTEAWHLLPEYARLKLMRWAQQGAITVFDLGEGATDDLLRLLEKYKDRPMDLADASLVLLAERTGVFDILTIDRDFDVYRARGNTRFRQVLS